MSKFEAAVLETALTKLFTGSSFYISDLQDIGKLIGVSPEQHPNFKFLRALHCVSYCDMPQAILCELQQKVAECLKPTFDPATLAKALLMEGNDHIPTEDMYLE